MVLYRKYRPQKLSELSGQEHIKKTLKNALLSGRLSHAYLFAGPRGVGKTTTARILAKAINCEAAGPAGLHISRASVGYPTRLRANVPSVRPAGSGRSLDLQGSRALGGTTPSVSSSHLPKPSTITYDEPCDKCISCLAIREGRHLDLIEIDAASNRGIDEIRDLREKVGLLPTQARFKVYIIDEVHMLTPEAFNALLKTLEEPPAHVVFVLCTTEPHKLPQTIVSRCQRYNFGRAQEEELVESLIKIVKSEKLKFEEEALWEVAKRADGSFRDATTILEQLLVQDAEVKKEQVWALFSAPNIVLCAQLLDFLISRDAKLAINHLNKIVEAGVNLSEFAKNFLEYLRSTLLIRAGVGDLLVKATKTAQQYQKMIEQSEALNQAKLVNLIKLFTLANQGLKFSQIPQLPLELAIVEVCETKN